MKAQPLEEHAEQLLVGTALAVDHRALEVMAGRERLDRLHEAAVPGILDEALDRPRPGLGMDMGAMAHDVGPEAERRAERRDTLVLESELERDCAPAALHLRDHGVGRPEIEAERFCHGSRLTFMA
jgi:hypothetical protein